MGPMLFIAKFYSHHQVLQFLGIDNIVPIFLVADVWVTNGELGFWDFSYVFTTSYMVNLSTDVMM